MNEKGNNKVLLIIIGIISGIFVVAIAIFLSIKFLFNDRVKTGSVIGKSKFYADGYNLEYNGNWSKKTFSDETEGLMFKKSEAYIIPLGNSALSEMEEKYNFDFDKESERKILYDKFYSYWNRSNNKLYSGSEDFRLLSNNTYYATMNYTNTLNNKKGKMYLIVNKNNNIVISLMSDIKYESNNNDVLDVIKTIKIEKMYNNELANSLSSMSNWNRYSSLRNDKLGLKKSINGGWRILENSEEYWVFKDGKFWWYKSYKNLDDNYWYGTSEIIRGKNGLKEAGIDESKIDSITSNSHGKVKEDDIYYLKLIPSKIISGGVDKSSTNINGGTFNMVWILVDHGTEGIEAQILNIKNYETSYYFKLND